MLEKLLEPGNRVTVARRSRERLLGYMTGEVTEVEDGWVCVENDHASIVFEIPAIEQVTGTWIGVLECHCGMIAICPICEQCASCCRFDGCEYDA